MFADWRILLGTLLCSFLLTPLIRYFAKKRSLVDVPNERSSHGQPTPRGGGLAIFATYTAALIILFVINVLPLSLFAAFAGAGFLVAAVGFCDDHGHVPPRWRILVHIMAVLFAWLFINIWAMNLNFSIADWVFNIFLMVSVVWMLNLYNFMDGIDAIVGAETIFVGVSSALFFGMSDASPMAAIAIVLVASTAGFLIWNFPPARIFMGDVGSGFLGIVVGLLALAGITSGSVNVWVWMILLGVFLVDATVTVARRMMRGSKCYEAHRSHAYQHAASYYESHLKVVVFVTILNVFWLFPWAVAAWRWKEFGAFFVVVALSPLVYLAFRFKAGDNSPIDNCESNVSDRCVLQSDAEQTDAV